MNEWDWSGSEAAFKRAIDLDPNASLAHQWYAGLLRLYPERRDEALHEARRAELLDPLSLPVKAWVGEVLYYQHRYDEAIKVWEDVLELDPDYGLAIYNQGLAYAQKGLGEQTIAAAQRAAGRWREGQVGTTWLLGIGYALSGQRDRARAILRQLEWPGHVAPLRPG
jgi:tetratricopeptide (TPR) repeat protein